MNKGKIRCQHCYESNPLLLHRQSANKYGSVYYMCRNCSKERARKYASTEKGRLAIRKAIYKSMLKHKEKQKARALVNFYVKTGKIEKPKQCFCGNTKSIQAHHEDYSKPLAIDWLCRDCHTVIHRKELVDSSILCV